MHANLDPAKNTNPQAVPTWLSQQEMAARLRVHPLTLARLADAGRIPRLRLGRLVRYPAEEVEAALMDRRF